MIAALFIAKNGTYWNHPEIDAWDEERNAFLYKGPHPVIAHPPCQRWCKLAKFCQSRWGLRVGDDGGTFQFALSAVREFTGVLEHPAYSLAFKEYGLGRPIRGSWQPSPAGGWITEVSQCAYGHRAFKRTWLYTTVPNPIQMDWSEPEVKYRVSGSRTKSKRYPNRRKMLSKRESSSTPPLFRDKLMELLRGTL